MGMLRAEKCRLPGLFLFNPAKTYADKTAMMYEFFEQRRLRWESKIGRMILSL
jgi:hypothetical protein